MNLDELLTALHRLKVETGSLACMGCGYEHNCSTHGCKIIRLAEDKLRTLNREKQACFRLGQMDMRDSIADRLRGAAGNVCGIAKATLDCAVDMVRDMEALQ